MTARCGDLSPELPGEHREEAGGSNASGRKRHRCLSSGPELNRPGERDSTREVGDMRERDSDLYPELLGSDRGGAV
jgi:hypothetical protein